MNDIIKFLGNENSKFEKILNEKIKKSIVAGDIKQDEAKSITDLKLCMLKEDVKIDEKELRHLQTLCQLYNNEIKIFNITSHRKFIGKFIVFGKKFILKIISFALKNYIKQQQTFNAVTIKSLIDIYNKR